MEGCWLIVGLAVAGLVVTALVLPFVAFARVRRSERRHAHLEGTILELAARLARLEAPASAAVSAAEPVSAAAAPVAAPAAGPDFAVPPVVTAGVAPSELAEPPPPVVPAGVARAESAEAPPAATTPPAQPPKLPPTPAAAPTPAPPPKPPRRPPVDWERWVGVRGAAALGGLVLALAGLYLFKYTIEHGLISPLVRVIAGTVAGVGCVLGSELLRKRGLRPAADALAAGGLVVLYASIWAGYQLYGLIGAGAAFALLAAITAAGCALAAVHRSMVIAVLGLAGGFTAPLAVPSAVGQPVSLFGYLLLLDAGLLMLAVRRRWPLLGLLSLLATVAHQLLWMGSRMALDQGSLALALLALFALLFAAASLLAVPGERRRWLAGQALAMLLPFAFAVWLAARRELALGLLPLGGFLVLLTAAAVWLGHRLRERALPLSTAFAAAAVLAVWVVQHDPDTATAWKLAALAVGLALIHAGPELLAAARRPVAGSAEAAPGTSASRLGALALRPEAAAAGGLLVVLIAAPLVGGAAVALWPWLAGWLGLAAVLYALALRSGRRIYPPFAAAAVGIGWSLFAVVHPGRLNAGGAAEALAAVVAIAIATQLVALTGRAGDPAAVRWRERAAALLPQIFLLGVLLGQSRIEVSPAIYFAAVLALGLLAALAAVRLDEGGWTLPAVALTVAALAAGAHPTNGGSVASGSGLAFAALALGVLLFLALPFLASPRLRRDRYAWWAAALAGPLAFLPLLGRWRELVGDGTDGLLPVLLAALTLAAVYAVRRGAGSSAARDSNLVWFAGVALGFLALAVPLQLDREWLTLGWALEGAALLALWRRIDHPGLKAFALALLAAVTLRLVANSAVLGYHPGSGRPILNWLAYTYLVPFAALLFAARQLADLEVPRLRAAERALYVFKGRGGEPMRLAAGGCAAAAIAVFFVWLNLTIFDAYAGSGALRVSLERQPARDLTLSIAWGIYALVLLGLGIRRRVRPLRHLSLGFLLLTIVKVFLYDLGELSDLYRVASLVGLAVSLLLVSVAYQRFTARLDAEEPPPPAPPADVDAGEERA